jgi:hypothetical protein
LRDRFPTLSKKFDEAAVKAKEIQGKIIAHFDKAKTNARKVHNRIFKRRRSETEQL